MKSLLAMLSLFLIGSLSVSVFSPGIHRSLFHGGNECAHGESKMPCSGHGESSPKNKEAGTCAVVLFGKSADAAFATDPISQPTFFLKETLLLFNPGIKTLKSKSKRWVRGPPSVG